MTVTQIQKSNVILAIQNVYSKNENEKSSWKSMMESMMISNTEMNTVSQS